MLGDTIKCKLWEIPFKCKKFSTDLHTYDFAKTAIHKFIW